MTPATSAGRSQDDQGGARSVSGHSSAHAGICGQELAYEGAEADADGQCADTREKVHTPVLQGVLNCRQQSAPPLANYSVLARLKIGLRVQVNAHDCEDIDRALRLNAAKELPPHGAESSAHAGKLRALKVSAGQPQTMHLPPACTLIIRLLHKCSGASAGRLGCCFELLGGHGQSDERGSSSSRKPPTTVELNTGIIQLSSHTSKKLPAGCAGFACNTLVIPRVYEHLACHDNT